MSNNRKVTRGRRYKFVPIPKKNIRPLLTSNGDELVDMRKKTFINMRGEVMHEIKSPTYGEVLFNKAKRFKKIYL